MSDVRRKYDEDFKKNAVKLSFASSKSVAQVARDLGVSDAMLYRWRQKYTPEGDKTRYATLEEENKALRFRGCFVRTYSGTDDQGTGDGDDTFRHKTVALAKRDHLSLRSRKPIHKCGSDGTTAKAGIETKLFPCWYAG